MRIFAKLELAEEVDNFSLMVRHCWATPTEDSDDETNYTFIDSYQDTVPQFTLEFYLKSKKHFRTKILVVPSEDTLLGHTTFIMENCDGNLASFWFNSFTMGDSGKYSLFNRNKLKLTPFRRSLLTLRS